MFLRTAWFSWGLGLQRYHTRVVAGSCPICHRLTKISPFFTPSGSPPMPADPHRDVRELIRGRDRAALATALPAGVPGESAWPYASLVLVAVDHDLSPI